MITEKEARVAASTSLDAAIQCCIQHWEENRDADAKDLNMESIAPSLCALCLRFNFRAPDHGGCPLFEPGTCCCSEYRTVSLIQYDKIFDFRVACDALIQKLKSIVETYTFGDSFKVSGTIYMLCFEADRYEAALVNVETGNYWSKPHKVVNASKITAEEMDKIAAGVAWRKL